MTKPPEYGMGENCVAIFCLVGSGQKSELWDGRTNAKTYFMEEHQADFYYLEPGYVTGELNWYPRHVAMVASYIKDKITLHHGHVHIIGFSRGARMAFLVGQRLSHNHWLTSIVFHSGRFVESDFDESAYPVPVYFIQGARDLTRWVPFVGTNAAAGFKFIESKYGKSSTQLYTHPFRHRWGDYTNVGIRLWMHTTQDRISKRWKKNYEERTESRV